MSKIDFHHDDFFFIGNTLNQNAISKTKPAIIKINKPVCYHAQNQANLAEPTNNRSFLIN
ncbi:hypothetical protein AWH60_01840 [Pseudoalteromonas haloplanktis]|nr:hypothetical protein AMS57_02400 [Pseudoalteromonas undina]OLF80146.1 hypothetical protein AWH60_01840 [Pseudoalteromonas haloplanktis]PWS56345.1 hypothetical protein DK924_06295 [Pseudoalteromonas sp. meg-B1]TMP55548.1 hypothetical protein CWB78_08005 [Pseudoalteromonas sp. S1612]TMP71714.1 hypothetical protein CWB76_05935 [Pseudoalteromonas sp. S1609]